MKYFSILSVALLLFVLSMSSCKVQKKVSDNIVDIDGNVYPTVKIGKQVWLGENLKVTHYCNGDSIPYFKYEKVTYHFSAGRQCDYENKPDNSKIYGKLYNFYTTIDKRNLCPVGWHVPSDNEWTTLSNYLGGDSVAGGQLKSTDTSFWQSPNVGATNKTGFTALLGGAYYTIGAFSSINSYGYWWSSSEFASNYALGISMNYFNKNVSKGNHNMDNCFSVRCIKDSKKYKIPLK